MHENSTEIVPSKSSTRAIKKGFPIVAIGASAGGLEAMSAMLSHLPNDTGMAFIYVQHLSPDHKSMLSEILSQKTKMLVQPIDDMDKIKPNQVFVIPYNKDIKVAKESIKHIKRTEGGASFSIDTLFNSLALAQKERVIGIVLSGSATDGTLGLKTIKQAGGLTFAQDDTAKFSSMPQSAIAAGVVDYILSPEEMAHELVRLSKHQFVEENHEGLQRGKEEQIDNHDPHLKSIFNRLKSSSGVDFSAYKMPTIKRRILRRMYLYKIDNLQKYEALLNRDKEEIGILYQDLLINVTSFFRDSDTHKYLRLNLLPKLLKRKEAGETLRIWVAACATGEEAYSIAMMLLEIESTLGTNIPIKIFATDLSVQAIAKARLGVYTKHDLATVSPKRIQRFFTKKDGSFRVNKEVRNMCVFAPHNILRDPSFSKLDFISCCNLFIYLDIAAQKKVANTFHYALLSNGFLMLGKSENISHSSSLFAEYNKIHKIFSRRNNGEFRTLPAPSPKFEQEVTAASKSGTKVLQKPGEKQGIGSSLDSAIDKVLLSEFMPTSVVINYQMDIVQFRGETGLYLKHPNGKASFNIIKMARTEFAFELRTSILNAINHKQAVRKTGIEIKVPEGIKIVNFQVVPLDIEWDEPLLLVLFSDQEQVVSFVETGKGSSKNSIIKNKRIKDLESDLAIARADALASAHHQDAFTQELQSANEEVVSNNEELQTLNEELETSKEEIESANEELVSTNQELQTRNELLHESYEYSEAIISTMHEPMLVLDKGLKVKSANTAFYKKFGVTEKQTEGMFLYDLGNKQWDIPALREMLEDIVTKNSKFFNYEVKHKFLNLGEKIMSLNASRIIQKTHREQLILLIIADITDVRQLILEKELRKQELINKEMEDRNQEKIRLEKAVEERTLELKRANELLEEKNIDLESMNKELEAFTYVSSHDLQEPVRKIQLFSSRLLETEDERLSEEGKKYFSLMQTEANRMQQLIRDLLAFSLVNSGDRIVEKVHLKEVIEEAITGLKDKIDQSKAIIKVKGTREWNVIAFQFRQLIHNLVTNAIKFSKPDVKPVILISCEVIKYSKKGSMKLPEKVDYLHVSISDNGIGFEKEYKDRIFEVFQRLHGKHEFEGTGIGLAIVKKIVENHEGIITTSSEVGLGSRFDIYIPDSN